MCGEVVASVDSFGGVVLTQAEGGARAFAVCNVCAPAAEIETNNRTIGRRIKATRTLQ
jgi:hypothetical protein